MMVEIFRLFIIQFVKGMGKVIFSMFMVSEIEIILKMDVNEEKYTLKTRIIDKSIVFEILFLRVDFIKLQK